MAGSSTSTSANPSLTVTKTPSDFQTVHAISSHGNNSNNIPNKDENTGNSSPSLLFCCGTLTTVSLTEDDTFTSNWLRTFISQTYASLLSPTEPWKPHIIEVRLVDPETDTGSESGMYEGTGRWFGTAEAGYIEIYPTEQLRRELECVGVTGLLCPEHQMWYEICTLQFKNKRKTDRRGTGNGEDGEGSTEVEGSLDDTDGTEDKEQDWTQETEAAKPITAADDGQEINLDSPDGPADKALDHVKKREQSPTATADVDDKKDKAGSTSSESENETVTVTDKKDSKAKGKDKNAYRRATEEARKRENRRKAEQKKRKQLAKKGVVEDVGGAEDGTDGTGAAEIGNVEGAGGAGKKGTLDAAVVEGDDEKVLVGVFDRCAVM